MAQIGAIVNITFLILDWDSNLLPSVPLPYNAKKNDTNHSAIKTNPNKGHENNRYLVTILPNSTQFKVHNCMQTLNIGTGKPITAATLHKQD